MSKKHQFITISPSGNLYGSENVLFDYLCTTELNHIVFVPKNSQFEKKLKSQKWNHRIKGFNSKKLKLFYGYLILFILISRIKSVYLNEAGHIRYIRFLAKLISWNNFFIHLRMVYDSAPDRIGEKLPKNITLIAISEYVAKPLKQFNVDYDVIYDGYDFQERSLKLDYPKEKIVFGIIGRITKTKGFDSFLPLLLQLEETGLLEKCAFHFYGENYLDKDDTTILENILEKFSEYVFLNGYTASEQIYTNIDAVLHLCQEEGLGRIFFEAIDYAKPFVGFDIAGIKEIGIISGLTELLSDPMSENWHELMAKNFSKLVNDYSIYQEIVKQQKLGMTEFSSKKYATKINTIINGKK